MAKPDRRAVLGQPATGTSGESMTRCPSPPRRVDAIALGLSAMVLLAGCTSAAHGHAASGVTRTAKPVTAAAAAHTSIAAGTSGSSGSSGSTGSQNTAATTADPAAYDTGRYEPSGPVHTMPGVVEFQTPSGNIHCTSPARDALYCAIEAHTFTNAPRPASCTWNWLSSTVGFESAVPHLGICAANPIVTYGSKTLPYGATLRFGDLACTPNPDALTCSNMQTGHGFTLSRAASIIR
jgi:hypothetical protein